MPTPFQDRLQALIQGTPWALPPKLYGLREKHLLAGTEKLGPVHALGVRWPNILLVDTESPERLQALERFFRDTANFPYSGGLPPLPRQIRTAFVSESKQAGARDEYDFAAWLNVLSR